MAQFVATVGSELADPKNLSKAVEIGVRGFRFNLARRLPHQHLAAIRILRSLCSDVTIFVDLPGAAKARVGRQRELVLVANELFEIRDASCEAPPLDKSLIIGGTSFVPRASPGSELRIGTLDCRVLESRGSSLICVTIDGGTVQSGQSIIWSSASPPVDSLTSDDVRLTEIVREIKPTYVALSFSERIDAIYQLRCLLGDTNIKILAKIETVRGLVRSVQLAEAADGLMIGRNDLSSRVTLAGVSEATNELGVNSHLHQIPYVVAAGLFSSIAKGKGSLSLAEVAQLSEISLHADWVVSDETSYSSNWWKICEVALQLGLLGYSPK